MGVVCAVGMLVFKRAQLARSVIASVGRKVSRSLDSRRALILFVSFWWNRELTEQ